MKQRKQPISKTRAMKSEPKDDKNFATAQLHCGKTRGGKEVTQMPIIATGKKFEICPVGLHQAKVREITQFTHESWGERVQYIFETDKIGEDGNPLSVFHEASLTLSPQSKLSGIIESILGREVTLEERRDGFDVESLVGNSCLINVKHRVSQAGNEYAYVDAIITDNGNQQQSPPANVEAMEEAGETDSSDEKSGEVLPF